MGTLSTEYLFGVGYLLAETKVSSCLGHGILLVLGLILTRTTENFHFRLGQDSTMLNRFAPLLARLALGNGL